LAPFSCTTCADRASTGTPARRSAGPRSCSDAGHPDPGSMKIGARRAQTLYVHDYLLSSRTAYSSDTRTRLILLLALARLLCLDLRVRSRDCCHRGSSTASYCCHFFLCHESRRYSCSQSRGFVWLAVLVCCRLVAHAPVARIIRAVDARTYGARPRCSDSEFGSLTVRPYSLASLVRSIILTLVRHPWNDLRISCYRATFGADCHRSAPSITPWATSARPRTLIVARWPTLIGGVRTRRSPVVPRHSFGDPQ